MMVMRRLGVVAAAGLAAVVVLAGCGSDGGSEAAAPTTEAVAKPAVAKENATTGCRDLYNGGPLECAANTIGPGGGVIFYDAGSVQPWGRFLEAAPWTWNPQYGPGESTGCDYGCGADSTTILAPMKRRTQDLAPGGKYYGLCGDAGVGTKHDAMKLVGKTGTALGAGRDNTKALLADPQCAEIGTGSHTGVVRLVASYRGGGLDDWFIPSKDELHLLYQFGNRNGIGGFDANGYVSSSIRTDGRVWSEDFRGTGAYTTDTVLESTGAWNNYYLVRPIRAFS